MHRPPLLLCVAALLASCASTSSSTEAVSCSTRTAVPPFSLCVPQGWTATTSSFGTQGSSIVNLVRTASDEPALSIHVKHEKLDTPVTSSLQFAKRARDITSRQAPSYVFVSLSSIVADGLPSLLHVFSAKPFGAKEAIAYYQMVIPYGEEGYGFSATREREPRQDDVDIVRAVFESIQFRSEDGGEPAEVESTDLPTRA